MSASAIILGMAAKIGAPIIKSIIEKKIGGVSGDLAGAVIDAVAEKAGVAPDQLVTAPLSKVEEAVRQVEAEAPEMIALYEAGLKGQFELLQAELQEGFWQSAWRWGWMYLLAFLWVCAFLLFPVLKAFGIALDPIDSATLMTLTGWFISLYMGGHTVKEIGRQAVEAVKSLAGGRMYSDFDREVGEMRVEQERQARIKAAGAALRVEGREECECGATISAARRRVYPSATRCLECQEIAEKEIYCR